MFLFYVSLLKPFITLPTWEILEWRTKNLISTSQTKAVSNPAVYLPSYPVIILASALVLFAASLKLQNSLLSNCSSWNHAELFWLYLRYLNMKIKFMCKLVMWQVDGAETIVCLCSWKWKINQLHDIHRKRERKYCMFQNIVKSICMSKKKTSSWSMNVNIACSLEVIWSCSLKHEKGLYPPFPPSLHQWISWPL